MKFFQLTARAEPATSPSAQQVAPVKEMNGKRDRARITYLLVFYGGQGVDILLEPIPRFHCNAKSYAQVQGSFCELSHVFTSRRRKPGDASRRDSRENMRQAGNLTHLASPGPSEIA